MKKELLESASKVIPNTMVLINVVSRRVRQINQGHRPLVGGTEKLTPMDIALKEITEGKVKYEFVEPAEDAEAEIKRKKKK
jgi:DNA-directed RNA polymerase subunit omega